MPQALILTLISFGPGSASLISSITSGFLNSRQTAAFIVLLQRKWFGRAPASERRAAGANVRGPGIPRSGWYSPRHDRRRGTARRAPSPAAAGARSHNRPAVHRKREWSSARGQRR